MPGDRQPRFVIGTPLSANNVEKNHGESVVALGRPLRCRLVDAPAAYRSACHTSTCSLV
jgi:hypothetical protein